MQDGRLGGPPNEVNLRHAVGPYLRSEVADLRSFVAVDMAHTIMLEEQGILTKGQAGSILASLEAIDALGPDGFPTEPEYGSLLGQIERFIAERAGEDTAGRMHTGRSRNDQSAAVSRLASRDALIDVLASLSQLQIVMLSLARRHLDTYMPGYTHLQHAQPTTLAHYLMRHWFIFERDQQRLEGAFERTNLSSLGGAAMTGTSWPLNRPRVSELLGHERPVENAYDAGIFTRDYPAENAGSLSILVNNVGRLAGDMYLWTTWEFGMAELDDSLAGISSIMPQKKNPHALERIRGLAGKAVGWLPATLGMLRSVSSSDLELLFGGDLLPVMAEDTLSALELMRVSIETMQFNEDVMRDRADVYWTTATNLADEIVRHSGLSFRAVHGIVGRLVRLAVDRGLGPGEVTSALLDEAAQQTIGRPVGITDDLIARALDPVGSIDGLTTPGSAHPDAVRATIDTAESYELRHRSWLEAKRSQIESASAMRWDAARALIQSAGTAGADSS